jgi:hypothetical protein
MIDFTVSKYISLLESFVEKKYRFKTFKAFLSHPHDTSIILRHDIDTSPRNALKIASDESKRGIRASYYFRDKPCSYDEDIISEIADMNHEIGYHYENMDNCNGNVDMAWEDFQRSLEKIRFLYPVQTICMHGSPISKYDNRDLWKKHDYRSLGILGEPYLDIDWTEMFYITDTGRKWDGADVSIRDKIQSQENELQKYRHTNEIIKAVMEKEFPSTAMITTHPQRWTNNIFVWSRELLWQNIKNQIKALLVKKSR